MLHCAIWLLKAGGVMDDVVERVMASYENSERQGREDIIRPLPRQRTVGFVFFCSTAEFGVPELLHRSI
jgi:hypothetical protein